LNDCLDCCIPDKKNHTQKSLVAFTEQVPTSPLFAIINPLKPKRRPLYLKTQSVPRSKHFSSRL